MKFTFAKWAWPALLLLCLMAAQPATLSRANPPAAACAQLTQSAPRSEPCNTEIAAAGAPDLARPVALDVKTQGVSVPRSVLLPAEGTPYPLGWVLKDWYYSDAPGVLPPSYDTARIVAKAKLVYLYATINIAGMDWHLIGPDQWISGEHVAALVLAKRPEGVSGNWIALDLTEQTLTAYTDDTPVFATLISAAWSGYGVTREGLFQIYARAKHTTFRGPPWADPPKYVYNYVPSAQFFDGNIALHGAYWHDWFGYTRSHGCVNIPVGDAKWVWDFVDETKDLWGPAKGFRLPKPESTPYVYVYHSPPTGETVITE
jgi:L,D-transpeptidase catalytic domain